MQAAPQISSPPTLAEVAELGNWLGEERKRNVTRPKKVRSTLGITRSEMDAFLAGKSKVVIEWRINIVLLAILIVGGTVAAVNISNQLSNVTKQVTMQATTQGAHGVLLTQFSSDIISIKERLTHTEKEIDRLRNLLDKRG